MLPVKYRINKELLPLVLKQNRVFSSPSLNIRVHNRLSTEENYGQSPRVAVVIGNKVVPLSARRHLIKRRLHAILEKIWPEVVNNSDIIIQVKEDLSRLEFKQFEEEVLALIRTAKILK